MPKQAPTVEVYELENGGYGFLVTGSDVSMSAENNPFRSGFVPMTQEEAQYFAECYASGVSINYPREDPVAYQPPPPPADTVAKLTERLDDTDTKVSELEQASADTTQALLDLFETVATSLPA
ncbi:hypothetical protein SAMN02799624_04552 [Paenibacillus sp. UNC496MF]|uniref:hypothetical protein n=1 Tax=Paenibacillus sp. UNC496MF TaxID=1502753 RepID=UPI0008E4408C|nr:hypothetical protein [Paenibacillus sp. UNC496MF]SFJ44548.1 hypothetical protein SAMN02799624_04552 [Paenibacillus sp. UNC496MF]